MDPLNSILNQLTMSGIPGCIIAALLIWVFRLMSQIERVQQARIDDAKAFTDRALLLQEGVHRSIERIEDLHTAITKTNRAK